MKRTWDPLIGKAPLTRIVLMCVLGACALLWASSANAGRIEAGSFTAHNTLNNRTIETISFQEPFDVPPIVIVLSDNRGSNSSVTRISNITTTGFDEVIIEPDNWDGRHLDQNVHYLAVEPGRHVLPDGTVIEAGTISTSAVQFGSGFTGGVASWASVNFTAPLSGTPTVLVDIQSMNSETSNVPSQASRPFLTAVAQGISSGGFQVALDRSQANTGPFPGSETIGWIALPDAGSGILPTTTGGNVNWAASTTAANVQGWSNSCQTNSIGLTSATRIVIASKNSRNNDDGGWLRRCSLSSNTIGLRVDEDTDQDSERGLIASQYEVAGIVAFSNAFHANLRPNLSVEKESTTVDDGMGGSFRIPGALVSYEITLSNSGNTPPDHDSLVMIDALPPELALVVAGVGAPFTFSEGTPPTGLTCNFVSLSDMTDCYSFSTDGSNFSYVPVDSGDGTDPSVTHVRIQPSSFMAPDTGSGAPSFTVSLSTKIR